MELCIVHIYFSIKNESRRFREHKIASQARDSCLKDGYVIFNIKKYLFDWGMFWSVWGQVSCSVFEDTANQ